MTVAADSFLRLCKSFRWQKIWKIDLPRPSTLVPFFSFSSFSYATFPLAESPEVLGKMVHADRAYYHWTIVEAADQMKPLLTNYMQYEYKYASLKIKYTSQGLSAYANSG